MSVVMTAYNIASAWSTLGRNPETPAELDAMLADGATINLGTRPFNTTYGNWADNQAVGFDISEFEYIALVVDYTLTITEADTYSFDMDCDAFGDLFVDGTEVCYERASDDLLVTTPIVLAAGTYTLRFRLQNSTGPYSFVLRWKKTSEPLTYALDNSFVGLPPDRDPKPSDVLEDVAAFEDYPHRLTIKTNVDDAPVIRRVEIRNRESGAYIASGHTDSAGFIDFRHLPKQLGSQPHIVTCFDDRKTGFLNALVYDRVFQVTNQGAGPEG